MKKHAGVITGIAAVLVVCACLCGCATGQEETASPMKESAVLVGGNTKFALDLYGRLRHREGNLFLSPYSISAALAMTYAGARGNTAGQMRDVLHLSLEGERLHGAFGMLTRSMNERGDEGGFDLSVANALWGQTGYRFLDSFLKVGETHYDAGFNLVDFIGHPEDARHAINVWVEEKTGTRIKDLLKRGSIDQLTRLVLTNAVYFRGEWAREFSKASTGDAPFWLSPDTSVAAPMMRRSGEFGYMETEAFQVIELLYEGDGLSMVVLLPKERGGLGEMEQSLSADTLSGWLNGLAMQRVEVILPRFRVTAEFDLNEVLMVMGMVDAFSQAAADLSGMTGTRDLFISLVRHKAFVEVNEEGTEAAAATRLMVMLGKHDPLPLFRADHPFLFIIRDKQSGSILFMGRLADPRD